MLRFPVEPMTSWKYSRPSPQPTTWAGRTSCRRRTVSAPSMEASISGSSSNTWTRPG